MVNQFYDPKAFEPCDSIGYLLRRSSVLLLELTDEIFRERGLSFTQWLIMEILRHKAPLSLLELSHHVGFDPATVSRAVEHLSNAGLVARERSTVDRRAVILTLASDGLTALSDQTPLVVETLNELFAEFSGDEAAKLVALLGRFLGTLVAADERRKAGKPAAAAPSVQ